MALPNIISDINDLQNQINTIKSTYLPLNSNKTRTSTLVTSTYLKGNQGISIINSNVSAGAYTTLWKYPSTNGVFTISGYKGALQAFYTVNDTITAGTNGVTKSLTLLDESGNSKFPGTVTGTFNGLCTKATGDASGNTITTSYASSASLSGGNLLLKSKSGATLSTVAFKSIVTTTYTSGVNWYRKYSDGWIEQGGQIARGATTTITFHLGYTSVPTVICGCVYNRGSTFYARETYPNTVTKTTFTITNAVPAGATTDHIRWYACGY